MSRSGFFIKPVALRNLDDSPGEKFLYLKLKLRGKISENGQKCAYGS